MHVGGLRSGALLEVGWVGKSIPVIVHAMAARKRFLR